MSEDVESKFKKGDYSVHVFLEDGKGILPLSDSGKSDPLISVRVFGKEKCTKALDDVGAGAMVYWGEHFYFEKTNCQSSDMESQRLKIEVKDSKFFTDSLIGSYEIDLAFIYSQKDHAILHRWFAICNPHSEDFSLMRGYLKLSISVLHESDKPVDLCVAESAAAKEELMLPTQIKLETTQLVVQLLKADNLPVMDDGGTLDAYCLVTFGTAEKKTSIKIADKATMSAYWYEEVYVPVIVPCVSSRLTITVLDRDTVSKDDLVGSMSFSWDKIQQGLYNDYFWANIYGAPPNITNDEAEIMNNCDNLASHWRGRVLLRAFKQDTTKAVMKVQPIEDADIKKLVQQTYEIENDYHIMAQVFHAECLPTKDAPYWISIKWAGIELKTQSPNAQKGVCRWNENLKRKATGIPYKALLPDIFIYLMHDNKPISFARIKAKNCSDPNPKEKWIRLYRDKSIGKIKNDWEGGFVKLRLYLGEAENEEIDLSNWSKLAAPVPGAPKILLCNIFQCKGLPPADSDGLADPYIKIYCSGEEASTDPKAKPKTLNPMWYETLALKVAFPSIETGPPIIVQVWDYDAGSSDDFVGMVVVDLADAGIECEVSPRPKWYKLNMGRDGTEEGEVLMSFSIHDPNRVPRYVIKPACMEVNVEIIALGLRSLKPALGWMPVNKAYVKVNLNSIQIPGEDLLIQELETQPFESGPNPNISSVLSFTCKIPIEPLYCPVLTCYVHDYMLNGLSKPLLGAFSIDLSEVLVKRRESIKPKTIKKEEESLTRAMSSPTFQPGQAEKIFVAATEEEKVEETADPEQDENAPLLDENEPDENSSIVKPKSSVVPETLTPIVPKRSYTTNPLSLSEAQNGDIVKMPTFNYDQIKKRDIEAKFIDNHYLGVGYNRIPGDGRKHYRYLLDEELEKSIFFGETALDVFDIKKGQSRGLNSGDKVDASGEESTVRSAGKFKGLIRIQGDINSPQNEEFDKIAKSLLVKTDVLVRVYVLNAFNLSQKDLCSPSDPYVKITLGKNTVDNRQDYVHDNSNPDFNRVFELNATLPGDSLLKIKVYDFDDFAPDEKIGSTEIDLEDRFYSSTWNSIPEKPIETRPLYIKSCRSPQGFIRLWVETHPLYRPAPTWDLTPKPESIFETRLIIWKSEGVPNADPEGVSDLYVRAWVNNLEPKETDTHYRCQRGAGSWNWRMKFRIAVHEKMQSAVNLQLWDRDFFSANDIIGDASFDFKDLALEAWDSGLRTKMLGKAEGAQDRMMRRESEKFWVDFKKREKDGTEIKAGKVLISFELVPEAKADACKVGEGREEPNVDPPLPAPEGRMQFSLNPIKMLNQMCGPEVRMKIYCWVCSALCCMLLIFMFPMLLSNTITSVLFG